MSIKSSLDWSEKEAMLKHDIWQLKNTPNRQQATKILRNFDAMIKKLSQLELQARRSPSHSTRLVDEQLELINTEIINLEQWITLLMLS